MEFRAVEPSDKLTSAIWWNHGRKQGAVRPQQGEVREGVTELGGLWTKPWKGVRSLSESRQTHCMNRIVEDWKDNECW